MQSGICGTQNPPNQARMAQERHKRIRLSPAFTRCIPTPSWAFWPTVVGIGVSCACNRFSLARTVVRLGFCKTTQIIAGEPKSLPMFDPMARACPGRLRSRG